jgi:lipid A ethanolaminephosphotransferase
MDRLGLEPACLRQRSTAALSHDHLFHSALGLLDLATTAREPMLDAFAGCRAGR